jgi:uncharacterized tellurite resistance protein B-like protein
MTLADEIANSEQRIVDCVKVAAVWIAHVDHDFSDAERKAILVRLPDVPGGVPLDRITACIESCARAERYNELVPVFAQIQHALADASKEPFLRLVVDIVAADGRVSVGERHALMFLADLVGLAQVLPHLFTDTTGMVFSRPADLSDLGYWEQVEASARARREQEDSQRQDHQSHQKSGSEHAGTQGARGSESDPARIEALATLGLVGAPSADEVRQAYRRLARVHHPDRYEGLGEEAIEHATRAFQRIQVAFDLLTREVRNHA